MEKHDFYSLIDISTPEDFKFYENVESIMESDDYIEPGLLFELFRKLDWLDLEELFMKYFEELFRIFPEKEDDLCLTIQAITNKFNNIFNAGNDEEAVKNLSLEIHKFKKWFVYDKPISNLNNGEEINVRDAIYNIYAMRFGGAECSYNFDNVSSYIDGYDIRISDLI